MESCRVKKMEKLQKLKTARKKNTYYWIRKININMYCNNYLLHRSTNTMSFKGTSDFLFVQLTL